jgi:transaldolase
MVPERSGMHGEDLMENFWRRVRALNPETEIWWDSSPLVWPDFREDYSSRIPDSDRGWFLRETEDMFFDSPPERWMFSGCTTNPPLSWNVLKACTSEWDCIIAEKRRAYGGKTDYGLFLDVYSEVIRRGAEKLLPLFEQSGGKYGHLSGQVDPALIRNEAGMREMAEKLADLSPNIMIKIPGSTEGMGAIRYLASKGISTNATLVYTVSQMLAVARMVDEGRKIHLAENPTPRPGWRAVCTHMSGRFDDSQLLRGVIDRDNLDISPLELRWASMSVVKKAARLIAEWGYPVKVLDCSHRLHRNFKGEWFYPHIEMLAGGPIVFTIPPQPLGDCMVFYRNREIIPRWEESIPDEIHAKLSRIEYYRRAYDENGFDIGEFGEIPTLLETEAEFSSASKEMIAYVRNFL